jgi:hypothetical protein
VPDTIKQQTNRKSGKAKMAQRKETKEKVKVRDLKPKKDAKGGRVPPGGNVFRNVTVSQGHQQSVNQSRQG